MEIPPCYYRVSVKALVLDDQKRFLLLKEDNDMWELPGGGLDFGEEPHEALRRELKEEMGLEAVSIAKQPSYFITGRNTNWPDLWLANILYEVKLKHLDYVPSNECVEIGFFTKEQALKLKLFKHIPNFIEVFNPENHR